MTSKWLLVAPVAGALGVGAGIGFDHVFAANDAKQDLKPAVNLPITRVVLFNSGVGYFSRSGEVENEARVDLMFPETDINDLLKSMVLEDFNKAHLRRQLRLARTDRAHALQLRHQPRRQPHVRRHRQPDARRTHRGFGVAHRGQPAGQAHRRHRRG